MSDIHDFSGKWITDGEFAALEVRNVFHRQLDGTKLSRSMHANRHILFRKHFKLTEKPRKATVYITADDYYKLYINGSFICQGPAPAYPFDYGYNTVDVTEYLCKGDNVIAVHTLYQGLINRVWVSGDDRHGLLLDLVADGTTAVKSDESFLTHRHSGYTETGTAGYDTQFLESYDSNALESDFEKADFNDTEWKNAVLRFNDDHCVTPQKTAQLVFESISPKISEMRGDALFLDFGSAYVGYLNVKAKGKQGDIVTVRCGQELDSVGNVRFELRCNCRYEEQWILSGKEDTLDWFDYKSFRYAELVLPECCEVLEVTLNARHYPFELKARLKPDLAGNEIYERIWELCVNTQKYGVQEVIQDCMEREKGFYVGDGCYTALTNMLLTGDDSIVRKLIDDAFKSSFITPGLVTCLDCSFMQEIAEYPLMLIYLILWHYAVSGDKEYLASVYPKITAVLESYRNDYEKNYFLSDLDKWCVVEWPANFQDGYDVDIKEGKVCTQAHVSINSYYIEAVKTANKIAGILGLEKYRDEQPLVSAFYKAFYDEDMHLFKDGAETSHISIIGNVFPYAFGLCPDEQCRENITEMLTSRGVTSLSLFCTFIAFMGLMRYGREDVVKRMLADSGAWLRMLDEGATATFEGWGRDSKWNTSLFHLTFSYAAVFLADVDLEKIFMF